MLSQPAPGAASETPTTWLSWTPRTPSRRIRLCSKRKTAGNVEKRTQMTRKILIQMREDYSSSSSSESDDDDDGGNRNPWGGFGCMRPVALPPRFFGRTLAMAAPPQPPAQQRCRQCLAYTGPHTIPAVATAAASDQGGGASNIPNRVHDASPAATKDNGKDTAVTGSSSSRFGNCRK